MRSRVAGSKKRGRHIVRYKKKAAILKNKSMSQEEEGYTKGYVQEALSKWHVQVGANASHISVPMSMQHFRDSDNAIRANPRGEVLRRRLDENIQSAHVDWTVISRCHRRLAQFSGSSRPITMSRALRLNIRLCSRALSLADADMRAGSWVSTRIFSLTRTSWPLYLYTLSCSS